MIIKNQLRLYRFRFITFFIWIFFLSSSNNLYSQTNQPNPDSIPFAPAVWYRVEDIWVTSVFCADLDKDKDLDLAVAHAWGNGVSILKNNGDGSFQDRVDYYAEESATSVFCADLDGDLDLDLAVGYFDSSVVSILKNNGDGTFQNGVDYAVGTIPWSVFCTDLDGDHDIDLAVANGFSDDVSVLLNNGDGIFQSTSQYPAGNGPMSVFCADLDGDFDQDIAVASFASDSGVSILKNNGDGIFQPKVDYTAGANPTSIYCADLDGDLDLDLAVTNDNSWDVSILRNKGNGTFEKAVNYLIREYSSPRSVFCADLDGDADLDLAVGDVNGAGVYILKNLTINLSRFAPADKDSVANPIDFSWQPLISPHPEDTVKYNLYLSRSMRFEPDSTIVYDNLLNNSFTDSLDLKLWYWKVKAYNQSGMVRYSDPGWSFYLYLRGDCNENGEVSISDVVYLINFLFKNGPAPVPFKSGEVNCDGYVSVSDVVYLINYLFKGGPPPC